MAGKKLRKLNRDFQYQSCFFCTHKDLMHANVCDIFLFKNKITDKRQSKRKIRRYTDFLSIIRRSKHLGGHHSTSQNDCPYLIEYSCLIIFYYKCISSGGA